jgi:hypothetical protein
MLPKKLLKTRGIKVLGILIIKFIEKMKGKKLESDWKSYSKTLPLSKEIYLEVFGEPKTHAEWADSFNKIGRINRLIIKHTDDIR